jgi:DNA-directed RNA polymerase subunit K/omega
MELLKQRVYQIASGYEDANDSNELRKDPILKIQFMDIAS